MHPAQTLPLIVAQASCETGRLFGGPDRCKLSQLLAHTAEGVVAIHGRLCRQQGVENSCLAGAETNVIALCFAHRGHMAESTKPLLRQQTVGAVHRGSPSSRP